MALLLKVNSFSLCIILFAFIALINQMTHHIPEELNIQQHYVKLESYKVDITGKNTPAFQIIHFRRARIIHMNSPP
jgi:hypothetical protein